MIVDFFKLSRAVQDRFIASAQGSVAPEPLAFVPAPRTTIFAWLVVAPLLVVALLVVARVGVGQADHPLAVHGLGVGLAYVALMAAGAGAVLRAILIHRAQRALAWRAGTYLFPGSLVVACSHRLRVYAMSDLTAAERVDASRIALAFAGGGRVTLRVPGRVDQVLAGVADARARLAVAAQEAAVLLDPLHDTGVPSPLGPVEPLVRESPRWVLPAWGGVVLFGIGVGAVLFGARNAASDARMFERAAQEDSVPAYRRYVALRGRRSSEVVEVRLPRAELREAERAGTVEAIQAFAASHPASRIEPEIAASLRARLVEELDRTKKARTVTALDAFVRRYPQHGLAREVEAARHALYVEALGRYRAVAADDAARAAMERVLAWAERHGPDLEVRVRMRPSRTLGMADAQVQRNPYYAGPSTLPTRFFARERLAERDASLVAPIVKELAGIFPPDVLAPRAADALDGAVEVPRLTVPTVLVDYGVEWSHVSVSNVNPRGVFVGVSVPLEVTLATPDDPAPYRVRQTFWRPSPEPWRYKTLLAGEFESKVYGVMTDALFEQLAKRSFAALFAAPAK